MVEIGKMMWCVGFTFLKRVKVLDYQSTPATLMNKYDVQDAFGNRMVAFDSTLFDSFDIAYKQMTNNDKINKEVEKNQLVEALSLISYKYMSDKSFRSKLDKYYAKLVKDSGGCNEA